MATTSMFRRRAVAAALGATLLSAVSPAAANEAPNLTIAVPIEPVTLDPGRISVASDYYFIANVFEGLYGHDLDGKLAPALAESVDVSSDGMVYTFTLRANARFHDGTPVTSEDVRFSWQRAADPATRNPRANVLVDKIANVEIIDARRFRVLLKARNASFLENADHYWYIIPKTYFEKVGSEGFEKNPIGSGPFQFVSRQINSFIKLRRFEGHWGHVPQVGEITMKIVRDAQARTAQVQTGEADLAIDIPPVIANRIKRDPNVKILVVPTLKHQFVSFNTLDSRRGMTNKAIRQALNMAIDRNALAKGVLLGYARVEDMVCSPPVLGCDAEIKPYAFDSKKANQALKAAGFDFSNVLKLVGPTSQGETQAKETLEAIAHFLQLAGVKTELVILEWGAWAAAYGSPGKDPSVDLMFSSFTDYNADASGRFLRSVATKGAFSWFSNPEIDTMLQKMNDFAPDQDRLPFLRQLVKTIHDDAPFISLWTVDSINAANKSITWQPAKYVPWPVLWSIKKGG